MAAAAGSGSAERVVERSATSARLRCTPVLRHRCGAPIYILHMGARTCVYPSLTLGPGLEPDPQPQVSHTGHARTFAYMKVHGM